jgi:hypothetical protein
MIDDCGNPIELDYNCIPARSRHNLAEAAFHAYNRFMERPDAQAILDATEKRLREENSPLVALL